MLDIVKSKLVLGQQEFLQVLGWEDHLQEID
jgi:hypothetical protein